MTPACRKGSASSRSSASCSEPVARSKYAPAEPPTHGPEAMSPPLALQIGEELAVARAKVGDRFRSAGVVDVGDDVDHGSVVAGSAVSSACAARTSAR